MPIFDRPCCLQLDHLHHQHMQLEFEHHLILDERDTLAHKLDECERKCSAIEDECRSLQETVRRRSFNGETKEMTIEFLLEIST